MTARSRLRPAVAIGVVVAFNLMMVVLAAIAHGPIEAPFVVAWIVGDFVFCLLALALTER
jgi:hypothetical protein